MKFTIPIEPRTKKNHQQIRRNNRTGAAFVSTSDQYKMYCRMTGPILDTIRGKNNIREPIATPVNVKAIYYMGSRRTVDISNLHNCLHDVLVASRILADDNCRIIVGTDGSRVRYDKANPRTEVEIEAVTDEEDLLQCRLMIPPERGRKT